MSKDVEIKFPHSANLFQFCRRVLDQKFGGARVIDQDVGQILGYDPADCSHWKKGKKNIRSIEAIKAIAHHLGIDEKLVTDIACGEMDDAEGFLEFGGYGPFTIDSRMIDDAKKEFYRSVSHANWQGSKDQDFSKRFAPNIELIDNQVRSLHQRINFKEAPLYLPEITANVPEIKLISNPQIRFESNSTLVHATESNNEIHIHYAAGYEMRPYVRYLIAKKIARFSLAAANNVATASNTASAYNQATLEKSEKETSSPFSALDTLCAHIEENIFAAKLLAPANLVRKELRSVNLTKDIVTQLAEMFWVSKTFMNIRLRQLLEGDQQI